MPERKGVCNYDSTARSMIFAAGTFSTAPLAPFCPHGRGIRIVFFKHRKENSAYISILTKQKFGKGDK